MGPGAHDEVLREIVRSAEQDPDMDPNHPDLLALKSILLQKISPIGDGLPTAPDMMAGVDLPATPSVDVPVGQALGLVTSGDLPSPSANAGVSEVLGLGTSDTPAASTEMRAAADPPAPIEEA